MTQQPGNEPEPKDPPDTSWVTEIDVREGDQSAREVRADSDE